jgi:CheY-like chemotaxis protein
LTATFVLDLFPVSLRWHAGAPKSYAPRRVSGIRFSQFWKSELVIPEVFNPDHARNNGVMPTHPAPPRQSLPVARPLIAVIDDDESVRESLPDLLEAHGFAVRAFSTAQSFLQSSAVTLSRCLILDVAMPEMSGPQLQEELIRRQRNIPIIFISGNYDVTHRTTLLARGATECLLKPFSEQELRSALDLALASD